jgi:hypothetical protein
MAGKSRHLLLINAPRRHNAFPRNALHTWTYSWKRRSKQCCSSSLSCRAMPLALLDMMRHFLCLLPHVQQVADPAGAATSRRGRKMQLVAFCICAGCRLLNPVQWLFQELCVPQSINPSLARGLEQRSCLCQYCYLSQPGWFLVLYQ